MKILLACAGGMSTGMLVQKMKSYAEKNQLIAEIAAYGLSDLEEYVADCDLILLGPQVSYQEDEVRQKFPQIPVAIIDMFDYSMMNGAKVMEEAVTTITMK